MRAADGRGSLAPVALNPKARKLASGKIELAWTPDLTCFGYRFYRDGKAVSKGTNPAQAVTTFAAETDGKPHTYGVAPAREGAVEAVTFPAAPVPPTGKLTVDKVTGELAWTPAAGAAGYQVAEIPPAGETNYVPVGAHLTYEPPAHPGETWQYDVTGLPTVAWYGRVTHAWPAGPTPPDPPPPGKGILGICVNSAAGGDAARLKQLKPEILRKEPNPDYVKLAVEMGVPAVGLATNLDTAQTIAMMRAYPTLRICEVANEPYYGPLKDVAMLARQWRETARQLRAMGIPEVWAPIYVQADGGQDGDYPVNGDTKNFKPWWDQLIAGAPDLFDKDTGCTAAAAHPYADPRGAIFDWEVVDKVRGQMVKTGHARIPMVMSECGWSVGSEKGKQVTAGQQEQYFRRFYTEARTRDFVGAIMLYDHLSYGPDFESSFGVENPDNSRRPLFDTFIELAAG